MVTQIVIHLNEGGPPNPTLKNEGSGNWERFKTIEPKELDNYYSQLKYGLGLAGIREVSYRNLFGDGLLAYPGLS